MIILQKNTKTLRLELLFKQIKKTFNNTKPLNIDVFIHIGAPKTGSSAIQSFLLDNRKNLEKYGYYYPSHGKDINNISGGHSNLGLSLINEEYDTAKTIYNTYLQKAKEKNLSLLLSAESIFTYPSRFKQIIGNESIKIIVFKRDPLEFLFSLYNQSVKRHFQTQTLKQFCENILLQKQNPSIADDILKKWKNIIGEKNIKVIEYNKELFTHKSIEEVFLNAISMHPKYIKKIKPKQQNIVNRSYSSAALELKRLLNDVIDEHHKKLNDEIDWYLQYHSDQSNENYHLYQELPETLISKLEKHFSTNIHKISPNNFSSLKKLQKILQLVDSLKQDKKELYTHIVKCITNHIRTKDTLSCDIKQLCVWFDIDTDTIDERPVWFNRDQLSRMSEGKYREADFLRDIAILSRDKGDIEYAYSLISKALELRPNGPFIIELEKQISKLKNQK